MWFFKDFFFIYYGTTLMIHLLMIKNMTIIDLFLVCSFVGYAVLSFFSFPQFLLCVPNELTTVLSTSSFLSLVLFCCIFHVWIECEFILYIFFRLIVDISLIVSLVTFIILLCEFLCFVLVFCIMVLNCSNWMSSS